MVKSCGSVIYAFVLLCIHLPLQTHARKDCAEIKRKLLARENHHTQNIFFAACNCLSYEEYENELEKMNVGIDPKHPEDVLDRAHRLTMAMGCTEANRRIVRSLEKRERPWTHDGRETQAKLFFSGVGCIVGVLLGVTYSDTIIQVAKLTCSCATLKLLLSKIKGE